MEKKFTEEEQMAVNCSFENSRKAMARAGQETRRNIEVAGKSIYVLKRFYMDNLINRRISSVIAVSEDKDKLIDFFHKHYFADVEFKENGYTEYMETPMGKGCFGIMEFAFLG